MRYVYVLKGTGGLYYGYTSNLKRRLQQHRSNGKGELVYYEAYKAEPDARRRERQFKHYAQTLTALKGRIAVSMR